MNTLPTSFKEMKRASIILFLSLLFGAAPTAQAQTLTIGSVLACAAPEVLVPVTGADLVSIGSITLYVTFDSARLTYLSVENIDSQLNGTVYDLNTVPFQLAVVWSDVDPVEFHQKKLFDIRFAFKGIQTPVTFTTDCEISNTQLQILPVNLINGSVTSGIPEIILQPKDTVVKSWALATFSATSSNAQNYLWKESNDNGQTWYDLADNEIYRGTRTSQLTLRYTPPSFNKYRYLCNLIAQNCTATTLQATLTVDTLASTPGYAAANDFLMQNKPNPMNGFTVIEYTLPAPGSVSLEIFDMCGNIISQPVNDAQAKGVHSFRFESAGLAPGIYFYRLSFKNENSGFAATRKLIKLNN
jgi:hypothetical protein